jgi:3-phenylpropionate/trans-cinnamate dioxygenase ferredoxin reductase subunit
VVGVGVRPATDWLRGSGLALEDGVVVDQFCATNIPGIYAAGDVASWPYAPAGAPAPLRVRLEHYDNALRQGEAAARNMLGKQVPYTPVPYFWSDQYDLNLQMVGYAPEWDQFILRGGIEARSLAAFYLAGGRLRAVVLVNRVRDLGPARRLAAAGAVLDPVQLADDTLDLRRLISR